MALTRTAHSLAPAREPRTRSCARAWARRAVRVAADDHLAELLLHGGDATLATDLATRVLAPLGELRPKAATRLRETLRAWLDHPGQVQAVAERLHVHPQTVRYRVAQLRELFGDRLDDPDARFELALALRSEPA